MVSSAANATASFTFSGTTVRWITHYGNDRAIAAITITRAGQNPAASTPSYLLIDAIDVGA